MTTQRHLVKGLMAGVTVMGALVLRAVLSERAVLMQIRRGY
jgi:hypothetical protein